MSRTARWQSGTTEKMLGAILSRVLTKTTLPNFRIAALTIAVIAATCTLAAAQDGYRWDGQADYPHGRDRFDVARDFGYEDGARVARQDIAKAKPYDPYPRGKYAHEDRGYRREYGNKYAYQEAYARAYQEGYERVFRHW